jgi:hypothetical protein
MGASTEFGQMHHIRELDAILELDKEFHHRSESLHSGKVLRPPEGVVPSENMKYRE